MIRIKIVLALIAISSFSACGEKAGEKKSSGGNEAEEKAIVQLLEKESATWRNGDGKAHADCWEVKPYSRILVSTPEGKTFEVPPAAMKDTSVKGNGGTSSNSNYKFSIHGDHAWVSHDEVSLDTAGNKSFSREFRMLEKINGQWKLVGQSIHVYRR